MKAVFKIFLFALALVIVQGCSSKPKTSEVTVAEPTAAEKAAQDKKEAAQKREAAQQERLRVAAARRAAEEQFYKDSNGMVIYNRADVAPSYKGGNSAMMEYFRSNLKYPATAEAQGWEGMVYVDFIIGKDGRASVITVTDETDSDIDQSLKDEAVRCVTNMPSWIPGKQDGKSVPVKYNLPVAFKLS